MPTEPDDVLVPLPPPSSFPCWLAFTNRENPFSPADISRAKATWYDTVLGAFALLALLGSALLVLAAAQLLVEALWQGYWQLPLILLVVHLPWLALMVRARRRKARAFPRPAAQLPKPDLSDTSLPLLVRPTRGSLGESGLALMDRGDNLSSAQKHPWDDFKGFSFLGEAKGYFAVRLEYSEKWLNRKAGTTDIKSSGFLLAFITPPLATAWLAFRSWQVVGWRIDVRAAACLAVAYLIWLLFPLCTGFLLLRVKALRTMMRKMRDDFREEHRRYRYLVFDSREVTAQKVLQLLEQHLENRSDSAD